MSAPQFPGAGSFLSYCSTIPGVTHSQGPGDSPPYPHSRSRKGQDVGKPLPFKVMTLRLQTPFLLTLCWLQLGVLAAKEIGKLVFILSSHKARWLCKKGKQVLGDNQGNSKSACFYDNTLPVISYLTGTERDWRSGLEKTGASITNCVQCWDSLQGLPRRKKEVHYYCVQSQGEKLIWEFLQWLKMQTLNFPR